MMMIRIKDEKGRRYFIPAPIWLIKAGLSMGGVGMKIAEKHVSEKEKMYLQNIDFKELKKGMDVLKKYKGLNLVDVRSKDGTEVRITI